MANMYFLVLDLDTFVRLKRKSCQKKSNFCACCKCTNRNNFAPLQQCEIFVIQSFLLLSKRVWGYETHLWVVTVSLITPERRTAYKLESTLENIDFQRSTSESNFQKSRSKPAVFRRVTLIWLLALLKLVDILSKCAMSDVKNSWKGSK